MKITREVRDFAARQNTDSFLAATPSPLEGEGDSPKASGVRGSLGEAEAEAGMAGAEISDQEIDARFAQMSERFREKGSEIYLPSS